MITDRQLQHELLKTALEATDNYLTVEKKAVAAGRASDDMVHDFSFYMSAAHDALQSLGVLDKHQDYMKSHVDTMLKLLGHKDSTIGDLPYSHVPKPDIEDVSEAVWDQAKERAHLPKEKLSLSAKAKAKARAKAAGRPYPNMVDNIWAARQESFLSFGQYLTEGDDNTNITEEDIDQIVNHFDWSDMVELYDDDELFYEQMEFELEQLNEKLSAQSRIKKRQAFARMKGKRNVARNIKLRRASSIDTLKKRAALAARRAVYQRLLRGRDKGNLSATEKDRIEQQVSRMKNIQSAIAIKLLPKMRSIEQKRLASSRGSKTMKASKAPKLKK